MLLYVTPHLYSVNKPNKLSGFLWARLPTTSTVSRVSFGGIVPCFVIRILGRGVDVLYVSPRKEY